MWVSDSSAYIFGINFGKRPLIASGFSKKSVEGFMGALAMSVITSILLFNFANLNLSLTQWIALAIIITTSEQLEILYNLSSKEKLELRTVEIGCLAMVVCTIEWIVLYLQHHLFIYY